MPIVDISQRISSLAETHRECTSYIARLAALPTTDPSHPDLATLIHHTLRDAESELESLHSLVDDELPSPHDSTASLLLAKLSKLSEDLKLARRHYRKAQLASKQRTELSAAQERDALLGGATARSQNASKTRNEAVSQDELKLTASEDVTAALRRTQNLMEAELSRSQFASETLAQSSEALRELGQRYSAFDDVIAGSKALIRDLVKKNKSDRWYYEKAIQLLLGTLIWIVVRRLFWGPIYLLLFMPVRMMWWVLGSVGVLVTGGKAGGGIELQDGWSSAVGSSATTTMDAVPVMETMGSREREEVEEALDALKEVEKTLNKGSETIEFERNTKSRRFEEPEATGGGTADEEVEWAVEPGDEPERPHDEL